MKILTVIVVCIVISGCQFTGGVRASGNGEDVNTSAGGGISIGF